MSDLIIDGVTGKLFKTEDYEDLANVISSIINDSKLLNKMGVTGNIFLKENYSLESVVSQFEGLYETIHSRVLVH